MNNYKYHNENPYLAIEEDCVCRAISLASGFSYRLTDKLLNLTANAYNCDKLSVNCYHHLLEDILGYRLKYPTEYETVGEICEQYSNNILIIRIDGHLTCGIYGKCLDIWNCTNEEVDRFWIVERQ